MIFTNKQVLLLLNNMLENLITSKTRLRLLIKFFISQANKGHLNGLASEMGESTNSIRKELNHLFEAGYLNKTKKENKVEYNVNIKQRAFKPNGDWYDEKNI